MFALDIETIAISSESGILSVGMVYVKDNSPRTMKQLMEENSIMIKFRIKEQIRNYKRVADTGTIEWWSRQSDMVKEASYIPSDKDWDTKEGLFALNKWISQFPNYKNDTCFIRGSLDQIALDSLYGAVGIKPIIGYNKYRDFRTAIDLLYPNSKDGYVDIDDNICSDINEYNGIKHHPVYDCALDIAMLFYGKKE